MRIHFVLNHKEPNSKLADVEIHFEEGLLDGLKLVGCSIWRSKKVGEPTILVPSRSYATAGGVHYYELLRPSEEENNPQRIRNLKNYIRDEYSKIAELYDSKQLLDNVSK